MFILVVHFSFSVIIKFIQARRAQNQNDSLNLFEGFIMPNIKTYDRISAYIKFNISDLCRY